MVDVVSIKLISGEEIIAIAKNSSDMMLVLGKPLSFVMQYNPENNSRGDVAFAPWMIGKDFEADVPVSKNHIIAMCESSAEARKSYLDAIGYTEETPVMPIASRGGARGGAVASVMGSHRSAPTASE